MIPTRRSWPPWPCAPDPRARIRLRTRGNARWRGRPSRTRIAGPPRRRGRPPCPRERRRRDSRWRAPTAQDLRGGQAYHAPSGGRGVLGLHAPRSASRTQAHAQAEGHEVDHAVVGRPLPRIHEQGRGRERRQEEEQLQQEDAACVQHDGGHTQGQEAPGGRRGQAQLAAVAPAASVGGVVSVTSRPARLARIVRYQTGSWVMSWSTFSRMTSMYSGTSKGVRAYLRPRSQ